MFGLQTPDITQAQIVSAVGWILGQAVATGLIDNDTSQWVLQAAVSVIAAGWIIADAIIRQGRAKAAGAAAAAGVNTNP
jgi:hypothetical protein